MDWAATNHRRVEDVGTGGPEGRSGISSARVLVVDDDDASRALCAMTLVRAGHEVIQAVNGRHGLTLAQADLPDLALLDVDMPELDGLELAAALGADSRTRAIPIAFATANTDPSCRARARALGAVGYLTKPYLPRALESLVALAVAGPGSLGAARRIEGMPAWPSGAARP